MKYSHSFSLVATYIYGTNGGKPPNRANPNYMSLRKWAYGTGITAATIDKFLQIYPSIERDWLTAVPIRFHTRLVTRYVFTREGARKMRDLIRASGYKPVVLSDAKIIAANTPSRYHTPEKGKHALKHTKKVAKPASTATRVPVGAMKVVEQEAGTKGLSLSIMTDILHLLRDNEVVERILRIDDYLREAESNIAEVLRAFK